MNTDATEETLGSRPASIRRSIPRMYASALARYCSCENRSVTFTGTPANVASSIAGRPCAVPGILMNRFSRPPEVLDRQLEEKRLAVGRFHCRVADLVFVGARFDRLIEDGWIGGQAGDRELLDVALQLTRVEHLSSDVVQPQALTKLLQLRRRVHAVSWWACLTKRQPRVARSQHEKAIARYAAGRSPDSGARRERRERPACGQSSRDGQPRLADSPEGSVQGRCAVGVHSCRNGLTLGI